MFNRDKIKLNLTAIELRLCIRAVIDFRNWAIENHKPTEDLDRLLLKLVKEK